MMDNTIWLATMMEEALDAHKDHATQLSANIAILKYKVME